MNSEGFLIFFRGPNEFPAGLRGAPGAVFYRFGELFESFGNTVGTLKLETGAGNWNSEIKT